MYSFLFDVFEPNASKLVNGQYYFAGLKLTNACVFLLFMTSSRSSESGTYQLTLIHGPGTNLADGGEDNQNVAGQTVSGNLSPGDLDAYSYTSGGNEWVTIARGYVSGFAIYGVDFDVFGPDGSQLA